MPQSTRLNIVKTALADIVERLAEMELTPRVRELRIEAAACSRIVRSWDAQSPSEAQRSEMMSKVLDLNVKVIAEGRDRS